MLHFARLFGFGAIALGLFGLTGVDEVLAQKKDKKADTTTIPAATEADYLQIQKNKEVAGSIVSVSGAGQSIILRVDTPSMEPNPKYKPPTVTNPKSSGYNAQANQQYQQLKLYQDIQKQMQQAANARTPQEQQRAMQRLQMDMARFQMQYQNQYMKQVNQAVKNANNPNNEPFRVVHNMKDYEFDLQEKIEIRKTFLPTSFDDTGNIKEYTEKEKAELRGDDKTKPGYSAKMEEVTNGTQAKFTLVPSKTKKKEEKDKDAKDKETDGVGNVERPTVRLIVLTKESTQPTITGADPKKKGKK